MSKPPIPAEFIEILKRPNPAVMATIRPDGSPVSVATWYRWEDDGVLLNLDATRKRLAHLREYPDRAARRVNAWLDVEQYHVWGY